MTELEKQLKKTNEILLTQIENQTHQNKELTHQIQRLTEQVEYLTRKHFGTSSEKTKISDGQLSLFQQEEDASFNDAETTVPQTVEEEITYRRQKKKGHKAEVLKNLPEEIINCELTEDERKCSDCGDLMKPMGKKRVREELHFIPAQLYKKVFVSHTHGCDCHDDSCESNVHLHPTDLFKTATPVLVF